MREQPVLTDHIHSDSGQDLPFLPLRSDHDKERFPLFLCLPALTDHGHCDAGQDPAPVLPVPGTFPSCPLRSDHDNLPLSLCPLAPVLCLPAAGNRACCACPDFSCCLSCSAWIVPPSCPPGCQRSRTAAGADTLVNPWDSGGRVKRHGDRGPSEADRPPCHRGPQEGAATDSPT